MANKPSAGFDIDDTFSTEPGFDIDDSFSIEPPKSKYGDERDAVEAISDAPLYKPREKAEGLAGKAWDEAVGDRLGFDTQNIDAAKKATGVLYPIVDPLVGVIEGIGGGLNAGIAGSIQGLGNLFGADPSSTDRAAGSSVEAFNIGSLLAGNGPQGAEAMTAANRSALLQKYFEAGASVEEMLKAAPSLDKASVEAAVKYRDDPSVPGQGGKGVSIDPIEQQLAAEAEAFKTRESDVEPPTKLEEDAAAFKAKPEPTVEDIFPSEETIKARENEMAARLQAEADAFKNKDKEVEPVAIDDSFTTEPTPVKNEHLEAVQAKVDETGKDWKNRPDIEVVDKVDDIADEAVRTRALAEGADKDALGFLGEDGKVRIIASNIKSPDEVPAILFHETLGHYGLAQKFGEGLKDILRQFYDNGVQGFREKVDEWLIKNPTAYQHLDEEGRLTAGIEEVLAEASSSGQINPKMVDLLTNYVKSFARRVGINLKYSEREINTIVGMAHDAVVNGKKAPSGNGFKYARRPPKETPEGITAVDEAINALDEYIPTVRGWDEVRSEARLHGMSGRKINKLGTVGEADKRVFLMDQLAEKTSAEVKSLLSKMDEGRSTLRDRERFLQRLGEHNQILDTIFDEHGEIARALNIIKNSAFTRKKIQGLKDTIEGQNFEALLNNEEEFNKFLRLLQQQQTNPAALNSVIKSLQKPYWEQYVLSLRHNMMLSGLATHAKNTTDTAMMIARELEEAMLAVPMHYARKAFGLAPGVSATEAAGRMYGIVRAALDGATWQQAGKSLWEGRHATPYSSKVDLGEARIPIISKVGDALHAEDVFFRSFLNNANMYALGVREAQKRGFKGAQAFQEGSNLALNPTEEMLKQAGRDTDVALLVDKPFFTGLEVSKSYKPNMTASERTQAFAANFILPFFRVTDRLIAQKIRRSPLSFLDRVTREDLKAGGARRDTAIARTLYGSALVYYYWEAAKNGETEGSAPDLKKKQALEAGGYLPNSVKEDGKYTDASALNLSFDPTDLHNSTAANVASIYRALNKKEIDPETAGNKILHVGKELMTILSSESFAGNLDMYTEPFKEGQTDSSSDAALGNLAGGVASSFVPAGLRQYAQMEDDVKRDTTGDKTPMGRLVGRIMSGIPEIPGVTKGSEGLPIKYDVYGQTQEHGRTTLGMSNSQKIKDTPAINEIQRLERTQSEPLVTAPGRTFTRDGEEIELKGEEYAEFQRVSGQYFIKTMERLVPLPQWKGQNDAIKKKIVKEVLTLARDAAKDKLYPIDETEDTTDDED